MANNPNAKDNLINLKDRTPEERSRIAKMGNAASIEERRKRKLMREMLEDKLVDREAKEKLTYQELVTLGLIKGAIEGRAENYKTILEVLGELKQETSKTTPDVQINIIDNSNLEKTLYEEEE